MYRVRQVFYYTRVDRLEPPSLLADVSGRLTEVMEIQFRILSTGDQRHLLRVYHFLKAHDAEPDTITAGLIHDVGKACRKCNINVIHRTLHVFCSRFLRTPYSAFARLESPPRKLLGLHRLANHAHRGSVVASQAGYNERVQWLIEHHEPGDANQDPQLRLLRIADDTADSEYDI